MDTEAWLRLVQLFIAAGGLVAVFHTLWQKWLSDNRAEWWKRFTWAVENANNETATNETRKAVDIELGDLYDSSLAGQTERELIDKFYQSTHDCGASDSMKGKDGEDND
ncbi:MULTISPECIES: hypothetical protein [Corynebacterium]|uniref:hypothetical protein n=1 Tax=Corynebacterium TaxID=1716 RepID=UPI00195C77CE|nr:MULTISPECIES: hypothetical protein [Corynebacterium]MDN8624798.1 hypothetical protein [Corynebacterium kroppenstedtii]QRQ65596.1 hypothetical protein I6J23_03960 [Corynebacterium kroppenstedtii]